MKFIRWNYDVMPPAAEFEVEAGDNIVAVHVNEELVYAAPALEEAAMNITVNLLGKL